MSQLKLTADSGGGTVAIKAPASTTGNAALDLTVPGTASATLDTLGRAGNILQVIQTTKTDAFTTTSQTAVDVTGFTAAITPSSSSNKVLVTVNLGTFNNQHELKRAMVTIVRGSTNVLVGDADTGHEVTAVMCTRSNSGDGNRVQIPFSYTVLDSPNTTSATTYKIQVFASDGGTVSINRPGTRDQYSGNTASTLILQEVAA
jgi:hypothetical protein